MTTKLAIELVQRMSNGEISIIPTEAGDIAEVIRDLVKRDEQWNEKWKLAAETSGSQCGEILRLQKELDTWRKAASPVTDNPQEDEFYKKADASVSGMNVHPEAICNDCGGANVVWFAPSPLWNKIVRQPDKGDPMLCPRCFILRADAMGIHEVWQVAPESLNSSSTEKIP